MAKARSTAGYPSGLTCVEVLRDGGVVRIRPVHPDDGPALEALHSHLSHEAVYFRYFSNRRTLPQRQIDEFVHVDYCDRMGFVIESADGELIAHGCYGRHAGTDDAEVAFEVQDEHWGRGLGTLLLGRLAATARTHGIARLTAEVLPENQRMRDVFRDTGLPESSRFGGGVIEIALDLCDLESAPSPHRAHSKQLETEPHPIDPAGLDVTRDA